MTGISTPTSETAETIPEATTSHLTIPPKIFIKTDLTFSSERMILKASATLSLSTVPPTSKKLAGNPPESLMISIVAIARPAPFTIHPIFPSKAT